MLRSSLKIKVSWISCLLAINVGSNFAHAVPAINSKGNSSPGMKMLSRLPQEQLKRVQFNKKRLEEIKEKISTLGKILSSKESKLASINSSKFTMEIQLGELSQQLSDLLGHNSLKQKALQQLARAKVAINLNETPGPEEIVMDKIIKDNVQKISGELEELDVQILALKSKMIIVNQEVDHYQTVEENLHGQVNALKESRQETLAEAEEMQRQIDNLILQSFAVGSGESSPNIKDRIKGEKKGQTEPGIKNKAIASGQFNPTKKEGFIFPLEDIINYSKTKKGINISYRQKVQVRAPNDGKIAHLGPLSNFGEVIIIDHGNDIRSIILGRVVSSLIVGDEVKRGSVIGTAGSDDEYTGQIYFEIRHKNLAQNTLNFLTSEFKVSLNNN